MISCVYGFVISLKIKQQQNNGEGPNITVSLEFRYEHVEFTYIIWRVIKGRVVIVFVTKNTISSKEKIWCEKKGDRDKILKNSNI